MAIRLIPQDEMSVDQRQILDRAPGSSLGRALALAPGLAEPYLTYGYSFRDSTRSALDPLTREAVIVRVGVLTHADFELAHHVPAAKEAGASQALLDGLLSQQAHFEDAKLNILIDLVDRLVAGATTSEQVDVAAAQGTFTDSQIAEITLLVGHYIQTALFLKTLAVPFDQEFPWPLADDETTQEDSSRR